MTKNDWIYVKDKLPELKRDRKGWVMFEWYLVEFWDGRDNRFVYPAIYDAIQKLWIVQRGFGDPIYCNALIDSEDIAGEGEFVSHWMPLPELRKEYALPDREETEPKKPKMPGIIEL